jgi:ABC-type transport system involved in Fe-S cluster assembly fused permease/ATPase subunit
MEETVINTVNNSVTRREEAKVKDHGSPYVQQIISFLLLNLGSSYVTSKKKLNMCYLSTMVVRAAQETIQTH